MDRSAFPGAAAGDPSESEKRKLRRYAKRIAKIREDVGPHTVYRPRSVDRRREAQAIAHPKKRGRLPALKAVYIGSLSPNVSKPRVGKRGRKPFVELVLDRPGRGKLTEHREGIDDRVRFANDLADGRPGIERMLRREFGLRRGDDRAFRIQTIRGVPVGNSGRFPLEYDYDSLVAQFIELAESYGDDAVGTFVAGVVAVG